jgi:hypothetical protein
MRKLKLDAEDLIVESFDSVKPHDAEKGTVRANWTDLYDCQRTNDPRLRECVTPYFECGTNGWTCVWCGGPIEPTAFC